MDLFDSITQVQQFVNVDSTLSLRSLTPFENEVKEMYLLDWLGLDQYEDLEGDVNGEHQAVLLPYVQRVIANFCLYKYLDVGAVSIGDSGVNRVESDNQKTAYKYQVAAAKQRYLESGWNAIESMVFFLEKKKANYALWASEARPKSRELMINSYQEFRLYYHVVKGRWTFEGLRAVMQDVELFSISPVIGSDFYAELKLQILNDTVTDHNRTALQYLNKAIAYLTIENAIAQKFGELQNNSFVFLEQSGDDAMQQVAMLENSSKRKNAQTMGSRYLAYAKDFLVKNKDNYPTFKTWLDAQSADSDDDVEERENPKVVVI